MRKVYLLCLLVSQLAFCQVEFNGNWKIVKVKTNHVLKGPTDEFNIPTYVEGKILKIDQNEIDLSSIENKVFLVSISENKSAKFKIDSSIIIKAYKDSPHNQFPGDELSKVFDSNNAKNYKVGNSFLKILNLKKEEIICHKLEGKLKSETYLLLFSTEKNDELILFSYNEEYIFFLKKQ